MADSPDRDRDLLLLAVAQSLVCPVCQGCGYTLIRHPDPYFNEYPLCPCRVTIRQLLEGMARGT